MDLGTHLSSSRYYSTMDKDISYRSPMIKLNPWSPTQTSSARISMGGFQIFKVDHWTWNLILADINTFAVPLSTYVIIEIQIKCYKSSYCVIVYVGHFWPPNLCPISVRYWIYTPISLILNPKYFLRLTPFFLCPCTWRARTRCTNNGGREGSQGWQFFQMWAIYCANLRPNTGSQSGS